MQNRTSSTQMENDQQLATMLDSQTLRVNRYTNNVFSVNCVPVIRKDVMATNGIIHLVDSVLMPARSWPLQQLSQSLIDDGRFRELTRLMALQYDFTSELRQIPQGTSYTFFAPNDEAFQKLPRSMLAQITRNPVVRRGQ